MSPVDIWKLYSTERFDACLQEATTALAEEGLSPETRQELLGIKAWAHYRKREYAESLAAINAAGDDKRAIRCHAYICAYAKGYVDDAKLLDLVTKLGDDVDAVNALVIRARTKDTTLTHDQVWALAQHFVESADVAQRSVSLANLLHNISIFYLLKARDRKDLKLALGTVIAALAHYGDITNHHHRAAANFWLSKIHQALTALPQAFVAAMVSFQFWCTAYEIDPENVRNQEGVQNAEKRIAELLPLCREFTLRAAKQAK